MERIAALLLLVPGTAAHGQMNWPPNRNFHELYLHDQRVGHPNPPYDGYERPGLNRTVEATLWFNQGCQAGCGSCRFDCGRGQSNILTGTPCCALQSIALGAPTLPREYQTWTTPIDQFTAFNPGRNPGFSPVLDSCGISGGHFTPGLPGNGGYAPWTHPQGFLGSDLPQRTDIEPTVWKIGETAEVSWDITANHGGAYQYRLCKLEDFNEGGGEACFQRRPLEFARDVHMLQFGDDWNDRSEIPAKRLRCEKKGLFSKLPCAPEGSVWAKVPIPACQGVTGGSAHSGSCSKRKGSKFSPVLKGDPRFPKSKFKGEDGLYGFGLGTCQIYDDLASGPASEKYKCSKEEYEYWHSLFDFNIIDEVVVPDVPEGQYVLSWRWDVEQTPQIWSGCSDVTIVA